MNRTLDKRLSDLERITGAGRRVDFDTQRAQAKAHVASLTPQQRGRGMLELYAKMVLRKGGRFDEADKVSQRPEGELLTLVGANTMDEFNIRISELAHNPAFVKGLEERCRRRHEENMSRI